MHEVLVNRLGGLSLPRKSVVRLTNRPDMTIDVYRGRKARTDTTASIFKVNSAELHNIKFETHETFCLSTHWRRAKIAISLQFVPQT